VEVIQTVQPVEKIESFFIPEDQSQRFIPFYLSEDFVKGYSRKKPPWGPIGEFTFLRTYSRWIDLDDGKRKKEKWHETVKRVVEGCFTVQKKHCYVHKVPWNNTKAQNSAKIMYELMFYMMFLPPGRGLWMMGTEYIEKNGAAALNNCAFMSTKNMAQDPIEPFKFLMDMSMLGVGVGFDTKGANSLIIKKPEYVKTKAIIPDTREGWVETMAITLNGFFTGSQIPEFDSSEVRPAGSPIKGFGGEASGPGPLMELVENIKRLLTPRIGKPIRSTGLVDICDMEGKCVVSGNVRRSALLSLGEDTDENFVDIKNWEKYPFENSDDGWRWASNNTVKVNVGQDYRKIADRSSVNGDPGYLWLENARKYGRMVDPPNNADYKAEGCNPCSEQTLEDRELCCLVETFPSRHKSYDDYQLTLKYAYLYAKTVTLIPTHWHQTNAVMLRNRRIGTSQSGIIDSFVANGRPETLQWCDQGYRYLRKLDNIYSDWLCIPRSIKITSVKPSGSVSLLPGVSPGIHYPHAEYYIRRVTVATNSMLVKIMQKAGYKTELNQKDNTATLVQFPIKSENFIKGKNETTMWEQLINASDYQKWWCDNQLSITVSFKEDEARDIANALSIFDTALKSVSFSPIGGVYPQMPYEEITEEKYNKMVSKLSKPDYSRFLEDAVGEKFCDTDKCQI
jgi:adenosylcobalamin-dependent ribonucleoside-triphosphate reductase